METRVAINAPDSMFVAGSPLDVAGLEVATVRDPATGDPVGTMPVATAAEVDTAVRSAGRAFARWSALPAATRGGIMHEASEAVLENIEALAPLLTAEQGKPLREAGLELHRFVQTIDHYAGLAKSLRGGYVPDLDAGAHGLILKQPLGVVAAIVPWNFPTTLLANKLGPALVTGNTLVAKPAETTPLTTVRVAELMHAAGLPSGVFNVVTGTGPGAGESLVRHPGVAKVAFTGSTLVGRRIMALAAESTKRLTLELGGSDPMIICADADIDAAVKAASVGRFFNAGQACLAVKRLYVVEAVRDDVVARLIERTRRLRVGPGDREGVLVGPLHTARQRETLEAQVSDAVEAGADVLLGGSRPDGAEFAHGHFYLPTLLSEPSAGARVATEEVFGPVLPIWTVGSLAEAIERANDSSYGLGSSIWTRDLDAANAAALELRAGYTWINSPPKVYDELPFGGVGASGFGREHGIEGLDGYTDVKSVVVRRSPGP